MNTKENVAELWIIVIRQISIIATIISQTIMFHLENANVIVRTHGWLRLVPLSISKPFQIRICNKFKHTSVSFLTSIFRICQNWKTHFCWAQPSCCDIEVVVILPFLQKSFISSTIDLIGQYN